MHAAGSAAALAPSSPPHITRGQATTLLHRQLGCAGCGGKRSVSKTLPSSGPHTGQTRSSSMVIHSGFRTPTRRSNLIRPWLWARSTSVRAMTSIRYCALLNTLEPAYPKDSGSLTTRCPHGNEQRLLRIPESDVAGEVVSADVAFHGFASVPVPACAALRRGRQVFQFMGGVPRARVPDRLRAPCFPNLFLTQRRRAAREKQTPPGHPDGVLR